MTVPRSGVISDAHRYSLGLDPYETSLKKEGIVDKTSILDVGCGAGMWTLAAARLNPRARVVGADIDKEKLLAANGYREQYSIDNCDFQDVSYDELSGHFEKESFDVIICNSVLQYIDEERAIAIFSHLLAENGTVLMYYNHNYGYFIDKLIPALVNRDLQRVIELSKIVFLNPFRKRRNDGRLRAHPITLRSITKISSKVGVSVTRIDNGSIDYLSKIEVVHSKEVTSDHRFYHGIPYVFACKGVKQYAASPRC